MAIYDSVAQLTGRTPLLRLTKLSALYGCRTPILAKLECFNPTGSVKDRAVFSMLLAAMEEGQLPPGGAVIEATGGNTAISLAMACAALSLRAYIVMPEGGGTSPHPASESLWHQSGAHSRWRGFAGSFGKSPAAAKGTECLYALPL